MAEKNASASPSKGGKRRSVTGAGLGLTAAALLGAGSADAATNLGDIAASDNRLLIILTLFVPALGWVLFNMAVRFEFGVRGEKKKDVEVFFRHKRKLTFNLFLLLLRNIPFSSFSTIKNRAPS